MTRAEKREWNKLYERIYHKEKKLTREEEYRFRELSEIQYWNPEVEDEEEP